MQLHLLRVSSSWFSSSIHFYIQLICCKFLLYIPLKHVEEEEEEEEEGEEEEEEEEEEERKQANVSFSSSPCIHSEAQQAVQFNKRSRSQQCKRHNGLIK